VTATDGSNASVSTSFALAIANTNDAPTSVSLDADTVAENSVGAIIGALSAEDPDQGDSISHQVFQTSPAGDLLLVNGEPVVDDRITVDNGSQKLAPGVSLDHEATPTLTIVVWATDSGNLSKDQEFTIAVSDQNDAPTGQLSISSSTRTVETATTRPLNASDITNPSIQFFNPANSHIYEFVNTDVRWDAAVSLSASRSLSGVQGHLVTITSAAEQAFIVSHMNLITVGWNGDEIWIGASDAQQERNWVWTTGPEQGQALTYSDWAFGNDQPSNFKDGADYGVLTVSPHYDTTGGWMDLDQEWFVGGSRTWENSSGGSRVYRGNGYVVEYSGQVTDTTSTTVRTLSADTSSIADQDGIGTFSYQWQWSPNGIDWSDITGAEGQDYEVGSGDAGKYLRVEVAYQDSGGTEEQVYSGAEYILPGENPEEPPVDTMPDGLIELNGHYYQIVENPNISRAAALEAADQASFVFDGTEYQGHLVTVTSSGEETLLESAIFEAAGNSYYSAEPASYWLGGEYVDNTWKWTSGPGAGQALTYSDWGGSEAGQGNSEPYLVLNMYGRSDINGVWYSYDAGDTFYVRGYIVEYEALI
jgi:hypothetical protein